MTNDPVHQIPDGTWWFWDEVWAFEYGPYETEKDAYNACIEHARKLNKRTTCGGGPDYEDYS